jgi:hypothetical protein
MSSIESTVSHATLQYMSIINTDAGGLQKKEPSETSTGLIVKQSLQVVVCGPYQRTAEAKPKARQRGE